jgi:hypothetical protein
MASCIISGSTEMYTVQGRLYELLYCIITPLPTMILTQRAKPGTHKFNSTAPSKQRKVSLRNSFREEEKSHHYAWQVSNISLDDAL